MKEVVLRGAQPDCTQAIKQCFAEGHKRVMLYGPTGFGKTEVAAFIAQGAIRKKNRTGFVVDRTNLVNQTSARFYKYEIPHGIIRAKATRSDWERLVVISAQTAERRGYPDDVDLLIVDEAHVTRKATTEYILANPEMKVIGLSATPFSPGLSKIYDALVSKVTTNQLIEQGLLTPVRYYTALTPDMTDAKKVAGEWSSSDAEQRGMAIVGDVVQTYLEKCAEHFGAPVKFILFSATIEHGKELCRQFAMAGVNAQQIWDGDTDEGRAEILTEFDKPDSRIDGVISCEALTRGFDVADIRMGICCRPYRKSFSQHIQQIGRVMRIAEGKEFAIWIDHAGNCVRFYDKQMDLFQNGVTSLTDGKLKDKAEKDPSEKEKKDRVCQNVKCRAVMPPGALLCPVCGHENKSRALIEKQAGQVVEIDGKEVKLHPFLADRESIWRQLVGLSNEYGKSGEDARKFVQGAYRGLYGEFARKRIEFTQPLEPTAKLRSKVQSNSIRYARRRRKAFA